MAMPPNNPCVECGRDADDGYAAANGGRVCGPCAGRRYQRQQADPWTCVRCGAAGTGGHWLTETPEGPVCLVREPCRERARTAKRQGAA